MSDKVWGSELGSWITCMEEGFEAEKRWVSEALPWVFGKKNFL